MLYHENICVPRGLVCPYSGTSSQHPFSVLVTAVTKPLATITLRTSG